MSNLAIKTKNLKGRRSRRSGGSDPGSPFTPESSAGGGPDRYRAEDESSVSTLGGSETPSHTRATNLSTASTQLIDNTASESSRTLRFDNRVVSPGSPSVSKNALVASRMLRSRKDRTRRAAAAQQLMERLVPARPTPINIAEENPTESLRSRAKNRQRVGGGGGFAKLMVQAPSPNNAVTRENGEKDETDNTDRMRDEVIHTHLTAMELERLRKQALAEFTTGPQTNLRYHKAPRHLDELLEDDECSEASIPSILNRSEVFHENAAAAVVALLTPTSRSRVVGADFSSLISASSTLDEVGLRVTSSNKGLMITADHSGISAFRGPGSMITDSASVASSITQNNTLDLTYEGHMPKSPISAPILSLDAERALNTVKRQMRDPGKTLGDLLTAVATPEDKSVMDRGFMVRRKNACGAVKVLTATASNRRTMCWTVGVLPALTSVLEDTGEDGLLEAFPDHRTRAEYVEARKRAVASLVNLAVPKENRIPIFHSPGLVQAVSAVIVDDRDESRQGCCALIAYLTKTQENRLLMVQVPGLIDALEGVIAPDFKMMGSLKAKKKKYHWDEDDSSAGIGNSTDIGNSFSTEFRNMSMATDGSDKYTVDGGMTQETGFTRESGVDSRGISYDDSDMTPQMSASPSHSLREVPQPYDKDPNKFLHGARKNVFASLMHVVREKDNAYALVRHERLMATLVEISKLTDTPSHVQAIRIIANMTRHRDSSKHIVFKLKIVVPAMVQATKSHNDDARQYALYALQNLSQDRYCRQEVANTKDLILAICQRARQSKLEAEKLAAISSLKNLTDDPANLIPMSNTSECFATLMQVAHGGGVTEEMQFLACDALATLSHWLRKIATSGVAEEAPDNKLFVPSLKVVTWSQWE